MPRNAPKRRREESLTIELEYGTAEYMGCGLFVIVERDEEDGTVHRSVVSIEDMRRMIAMLARVAADMGERPNCALDLARAA